MRGSGLGLEMYADADYGDKANDRRSVSGIEVSLEGTVVSHASKTSETEYITAGVGVKEALFVRVLFCLSLRPR